MIERLWRDRSVVRLSGVRRGGKTFLCRSLPDVEYVGCELADQITLQGFVTVCTKPDATVYTDEANAYDGVPQYRKTVKHSVGEYVEGQASTIGIESYWAMLKRVHAGTFHKLSPMHLDRYVREVAGRHNIRDCGTLDQMRDTVARLMDRDLLYRDPIADNRP